MGKIVLPRDPVVDAALATVVDNIFHLHCNGANNGTVFTDVACAPATITRNGTIVTSTAQAKFGTAAMAMGNASGNNLSVSFAGKDMPVFGDWTAECWILLTNMGSNDKRIFVSPDRGPTLWLNAAGAPQFMASVRDGATSWDININSNVNITTGSFQHLAWVKYRDCYSIYINGTLRGSTTRLAGPTFWNSSIAIGDPFTNGQIDGYIDEPRLARGAKYTGNFTPSASAFVDATTLIPGARLGEIRTDGAGGFYMCTNATSSPQGWRRLNGSGDLVA